MPTEPKARCTKPGCGHFATHRSRCDQHQSTGWHEHRRLHGTNTTAQRLGITDQTWRALTEITMAEHNGICHWCGKPGADHIDHIIAVALGGHKTARENLAPIHSEPCHRDKTSQELVEMRNRKRGKMNPVFEPVRRTTGPQKPLSVSNDSSTSGALRSV